MSLADQSQQWFPTSAQVTVLQARGLRIKGKNGTNDAYAIMQVAKDKFSTEVAEKSVAPMWKEQASFDLPPAHQGNAERGTLRVHVMHRALVGPDKPLGQAVVNLLDLHEVKSRNKTEWFKLVDKGGKADKERGEVLLDIQFMRNNMTASMFDLSGMDKSRSRLGKIKDKLRGKKKDGSGLDSVSAIVPSSFRQVLTDSEEELEEEEEEEGAAGVEGATKEKSGKKKLKLKSLFSHKSTLKKNMSQSMSFLGPLPERNQTLSGSRSSGLNVEPSEGKKKFKFGLHKRSGSNDSKSSQASASMADPAQRGGPDAPRPGGHVHTEEPTARAGSRASSTFSLSSSGRGSMEDLHRGSVEGSFSSYDSLRVPRPQSSPWLSTKAAEEGEVEEEEEVEEGMEEEVEVNVSEYEQRRGKQEEEKARQEEQMRIERRREEEEQRKRLDEERMRREELEKREFEEQQRKYQRDEEDRITREREEEERFRREEVKRREVEEERERIKRMEEEEEKFRMKEEMVRIEKERAEREEKERREEERTRLEKEEEEKMKREWEEKQERIRIEKEKERLEEEYEREREEEEEEERRVREEEKMTMLQEREERRLREKELEDERFRMEKEREEERRVREEEEEEEERLSEMQEREERKLREKELEEERFRMREEEERRVREEEERKVREEEARMSEMQEIRLRERSLDEERFRMEKERGEEERRVREEEEERMSDMQEKEERRVRERELVEERFRMEKEREEERRVEEETTRIEKAKKRQEEERILMEGEERRRREVQEVKRQEERERMRREEGLLEEERIKRQEQVRREEEERVQEQQRREDERRGSEEEGGELEEEFMTKETVKNTPFARPSTHEPYLGPNSALTNKSPGGIESVRRRVPVRSVPPSEDDGPPTPEGPLARRTADVPTARQRSHPVKPLRVWEQQSAVSSVSATPASNTPSEITRAGRNAVEVKEEEARGPFSQLTRGELTLLLQKLQGQLTQRDHKISELEQYIDNLLVRIMEEEPSILMSMNALKH
ncbi:unnamed protein product [Arctogadus glacialis]